MKRAILLLGCVWQTWFVSGCFRHAPKPGDGCVASQAVCATSTSMLLCDGGKLAPMECRGPLGCYPKEGSLWCDFSASPDGTACPTGYEEQALCRGDGKTQVFCHEGKLQSRLCGGPEGCKDQGSHDICDLSVTAQGTYCERDGDAACSLDSSSALVCRDHAMVVDHPCRKGKCNVRSLQVVCD